MWLNRWDVSHFSSQAVLLETSQPPGINITKLLPCCRFFVGNYCWYRGKSSYSLLIQCLVIGGGPCGLRTAIELSLMGAKVVVIEKRDSFSRHNVLHLWPFTIHDLRSLGAKKFYGKFCAGAIDHISEYLGIFSLNVLGVLVHHCVIFPR